MICNIDSFLKIFKVLRFGKISKYMLSGAEKKSVHPLGYILYCIFYVVSLLHLWEAADHFAYL